MSFSFCVRACVANAATPSIVCVMTSSSFTLNCRDQTQHQARPYRRLNKPCQVNNRHSRDRSVAFDEHGNGAIPHQPTERHAKRDYARLRRDPRIPDNGRRSVHR
jgi:hypothetical protein